MTQRIDLIVNETLILRNQKSESAAVQKRITSAYQKPGNRVHVLPTSAPAPPPPPPPVPTSIWYGRGAFTTTSPETAAGLHCDWTAIQVDPEGKDGDVPGRKVWWQSRPTAARMVEANAARIPYIAEVENLIALKTILTLFDENPITVPRAFVGLVDRDWPSDLRAKAVAQGWELLLEWYWNNNPSYTKPDAGDYPLFRNVVFGTFTAETAAGKAHWPNGRVYVDQYRDVWKGSFSIWDTEGAEYPRDQAAFNA